jgi:AAA+ ATPase superfamily predicted ATPase
MVEFTDRKEELELLQARFGKLEKGELVILYGRRRVGKTELVSRFLSGVPPEQKAYILVDEGTPADMLSSVSEDIGRAWPEVRREFPTWESFFSFLSERAAERKTVIALDEFQRMHTDPRAFTRFQKAWDTRLKDLPVMMVFLGSAVGAIHKIAISSKSPLFGRATGRFKLHPFPYQAFRQALGTAKGEEALARMFTIFGGMPAYLEFAEGCLNSPDYLAFLEAAVLRKNASLRDEPHALLRMELKDAGRYNSILAAIAAGHRNPKEISDQTGIKPGSLVFYLRRLEDYLNIIRKTKPLCGKHRPQYVFRDNFFAFWYKFVFRNLSPLEIENYGYVKERISSEISAVEGRVFEDIVRELVTAYNGKKIKGAPFSFTEIGAWWGRKEGDIDIVATGKDSLLVGEVKWTDGPVGAEVPANLEHMLSFLRCSQAQRSSVRFMVVSKSGFTPSALKYMEERKMLALTLNDVSELFDSLPPK